MRKKVKKVAKKRVAKKRVVRKRIAKNGMVKRVDYDSAWKTVIESFFQKLMEFFFFDIYEDIDWERGFKFLDKELQRIDPKAKLGRRYADELVEVYLHNKEPVCVLLHLEVQGTVDGHFAERLFTYAYRIRDRYSKNVVSLAILTDDEPTWQPKHFQTAKLWGCQMSMSFRSVKLSDFARDEEKLIQDENPFALVTLAHMKSRKKGNDDKYRLEVKRRLMKLLLRSQRTPKEISDLLNFLDSVLKLPDSVNRMLWNEAKEWPEVWNVKFEHYWLREAREKVRDEVEELRKANKLALEQAQAQAQAQAQETQKREKSHLGLLLEMRFGDLPQGTLEKIQESTSDLLSVWFQRVKAAASLDEVFM